MDFQQEYVVLFNTLQVRYYGIIIVAAMLAGAVVAARLAQRDGRDPDHVWGALTWAIIPAIIGARLWHILFPSAAQMEMGLTPQFYFENFFNLENGAIAIWSGGLSVFGAVLGGLLGVWLYFSSWHNRVARFLFFFAIPFIYLFSAIGWVFRALWSVIRRRPRPAFKPDTAFKSDFPDSGMNVLPWLDIAGVALPLAQAIGRWANFINQELYGPVTTLPWGITIDAASRVAPYESLVDYPASTLFHPLFLYESLWSLLAFIVLLQVFTRYRSRLLNGDIFLLYVMQYAFIRFVLEFLRVEVTLVGGVNWSQVVSVVAFLLALAIFFYRRRAGAARAPESAPPVAQNRH